MVFKTPDFNGLRPSNRSIMHTIFIFLRRNIHPTSMGQTVAHAWLQTLIRAEALEAGGSSGVQIRVSNCSPVSRQMASIIANILHTFCTQSCVFTWYTWPIPGSCCMMRRDLQKSFVIIFIVYGSIM